MAEVIGIASGVLTLAAFGLNSAQTLHATIKGIRGHGSKLKALNEELSDLCEVIKSLQQAIDEDGTGLNAVEGPLKGCVSQCDGFRAVIVECSANSEGGRNSFRDWYKLKYMGNDIVEITRVLAGYKSTILIALAQANFRTSKLTANAFDEFKSMIEDTYADMTEHLEKLDEYMRTIKPSQQTGSSSADVEEQRSRVLDEKNSTLQCLKICTQVSHQLEQLDIPSSEGVPASSDSTYISVPVLGNIPSARNVTLNRIQNCKQQISFAETELKARLRDLEQGLLSLQVPQSQGSGSSEQIKVLEMRESLRQCLDICTSAEKQTGERVNVFDDVSQGEDGQQVIVSAVGDLVHAKKIKAGDRTNQVMGQMSDESIQRLAREPLGPPVRGLYAENVTRDQFDVRYGTGRGLQSPPPKSGPSSS